MRTPGVDAADDVEVLARLHVAEPPRLALERRDGRSVREPALEAGIPDLEGVHVRVTGGERVPRVHVRTERPVVEKPDEDQHRDTGPAEADAGTPR